MQNWWIRAEEIWGQGITSPRAQATAATDRRRHSSPHHREHHTAGGGGDYCQASMNIWSHVSMTVHYLLSRHVDMPFLKACLSVVVQLNTHWTQPQALVRTGTCTYNTVHITRVEVRSQQTWQIRRLYKVSQTVSGTPTQDVWWLSITEATNTTPTPRCVVPVWSSSETGFRFMPALSFNEPLTATALLGNFAQSFRAWQTVMKLFLFRVDSTKGDCWLNELWVEMNHLWK